MLLVAPYFEYPGGLIQEIGWQGLEKVSRIWCSPSLWLSTHPRVSSAGGREYLE